MLIDTEKISISKHAKTRLSLGFIDTNINRTTIEDRENLKLDDSTLMSPLDWAETGVHKFIRSEIEPKYDEIKLDDTEADPYNQKIVDFAAESINLLGNSKVLQGNSIAKMNK